MSTFFLTRQDEASYIKVLLKQALADREIKFRELAFISYRTKDFGIAKKTYDEVLADYMENGALDIKFTNEYAARIAGCDALKISVVDIDYSTFEEASLYKLIPDLGMKLDNSVKTEMTALAARYINIEGRVDELRKQICDSELIPGNPLDYIKSNEDRRSFVRTLLKVAAADGAILIEESNILTNIPRVYAIPDDLVTDVIEDFKVNRGASTRFTNEIAARLALSSATRVAEMDKNFAEKEKDVIIAIAKENDIAIDRSILDKLEVLLKEKADYNEREAAVFQKWINA